MKRIIPGGILGGLVLFVWSAIAHIPPIGTAGERIVASAKEPVVLQAIGESMTERAIYMLPGLDSRRPLTAAEKQTWASRFERGPAAVVAFSPRPADRAWAGSSFATFFINEFLGALALGFLGAVIAVSLSGAFGLWPRALVLAAVGLIATIDVDVSYWNWYGFPTSYLFAQFFDHVVGWFLAGLVLARVCRPLKA
jgi:hypothetical protein